MLAMATKLEGSSPLVFTRLFVKNFLTCYYPLI